MLIRKDVFAYEMLHKFYRTVTSQSFMSRLRKSAAISYILDIVSENQQNRSMGSLSHRLFSAIYAITQYSDCIDPL